jgi:hypothetical protein
MTQSQLDAVWQINDTIKVTSGWVEWSREAYNPQPSSWIEQGFSFEDHARECLINPGDLFLELVEIFNWTTVSARLPPVNDVKWGPDDWVSFEEYIAENPAYWLSWNWGLDSLRYGISENRTFVEAELEEDKASVTVWCHVTRVAEFLIARQVGDPCYLLAFGVGEIFDLRSISLGKLETYEYCRDFTSTGMSIHIHFSAPSNILRKKGELHTATIPIDARDQEEPSKYDRNIIIEMPSTTEVTEATPSDTVEIGKNLAIFTIQQYERLPDSFNVKSEPTKKTLLEMLLNPQALSVVFTVVVGIYPSIRTVKMIKRRRTYNRLLRLSVKLYHKYRSNPDALEKEMDNLTESVFTSFIGDRLTDDQLEKLLHRRDDLLTRMRSELPSSP